LFHEEEAFNSGGFFFWFPMDTNGHQYTSKHIDMGADMGADLGGDSNIPKKPHECGA
tara:strand:+ start:59 stop:229 length:171 start_codon:yes stop_codon:yes gene_type:complete